MVHSPIFHILICNSSQSQRQTASSSWFFAPRLRTAPMAFTPTKSITNAGIQLPSINISNTFPFTPSSTSWNKNKTPFRTSSSSSSRRLLARAQRATWLPGLDPPPHLDGTLVGDFGFDPLGLGEDPKSLKWYVQAELVHCRFAMAGVAGVLVTDFLRVTGVSNLPVWFEAGAVKFDFASTQALFIVQLLLMGFAETKRYMDFVSPGSQAKEGTFIGLEASLEGLQPGYPGGPLFDPLGLAKDVNAADEMKLKEIKNGRLAMVAMLGIFVQASVTHVGPIENLLTHVSDPFNRTIIQTITSSHS
ncbi:photosystem I chlorophyll a/b-binding protein 5, chloroplastic-like isoform X1 [Typha angustifolia]|uniref:photosystem I chlorophyll a/b-binding protein 5, chloroplastic-like isoform X1 n=1 Tax=Typha angustifolia TaxID=59011 RepID=UPI003C2D4C4E